MANISVNQYFHLVQTAFDEKRGEQAAALLSIKDPHVMNYRLHIEHPENLVQNFLECPYDELVAAHLKCCWAVNNHDFIKAYQCQVIGVQTFTKVFQSQKEENWALPIMYSLAVDLRMLANNADLELSKSSLGKPGETLEKSAELLMGCFRICAADNRSAEEDTKRLGMLNLVNQLFKIYFKINKLHLCKPLIRAIESSQFKDSFSLSQQVTYRYYVGRKAMFDSDFKNAEEYLSYAFKRCHRLCKRNKRLILIYLIPVKMLLGHMPKESLLRKYDLLQFLEVAQSVKEGNLLHLTRALDRHERFFIKCGIFLILEKLKIITYRNLFKKV